MLSLATGQIVTRDQFRIAPMPASAVARINFLAAADGRVESISALLDHPPDPTTEDEDTSTTTSTTTPTPTEDEDTSTTTPTPTTTNSTSISALLGHPLDPTPTALSVSTHNLSEPHATDEVPDKGRDQGHISDEGVPDNGRDQVHISDEGDNINEDAELDKYSNNDEETNHDDEPDIIDSTRKQRMLNMFRFGIESAMKVSVTEALKTRGGAARAVINSELQQMITRKVWTAVKPYSLTAAEHARVIRSREIPPHW